MLIDSTCAAAARPFGLCCAKPGVRGRRKLIDGLANSTQALV
jgi:hypothetical protein